jgi:hypothetical protein
MKEAEKQVTVRDLLMACSGIYQPGGLRNSGHSAKAARARKPCSRDFLVLQQLGLQRPRHDLSAGNQGGHL